MSDALAQRFEGKRPWATVGRVKMTEEDLVREMHTTGAAATILEAQRRGTPHNEEQLGSLLPLEHPNAEQLLHHVRHS